MRRLALITLLLWPAPAAADWPDAIGPFTVGDDAASLRLSGMAQLQLDVERPGEAALRVRRLRPIARASFAGGLLGATAHLELAPGQAELIDLFVEARLDPALHLRAGQLKVPYTVYRQQSPTRLALVDWPVTSRWFGAERQLGVTATGALGPVGYAFGAFAGENRRAAHARELPAFYGEDATNPSRLSDLGAPESPHLELFARLEHAHPDLDPTSQMDARGGELRHLVAASVAWDTAPTARRDLLLRVAPELWVQAHGLSLTLVGHLALFEDATGAPRPAGMGALAELGWHAHRHVELTLRVARVDLTAALRADAARHAARLEPRDADAHAAWEAQYGDAGTLRATQEVALGVNVLVIGRSLAWRSDVAWLRVERTDGARDALRFRTQLSLAF